MTDLQIKAPTFPAPERIIGESWAARRGPGLAASAAAVREREPCPICGHPTGDCTSERH